ncbi:beta-N-acetylhexosaminidase [Planctomonas sp. JC2975]|nr:beta-N-acetylhexosaminidase [Planctomonas sp. JC2975]
MGDPLQRTRAIATTLLPGFVGTELPEALRVRLEAGLGGVCVFGPNIASPAQLNALNEAILTANQLAVIAIDEESGDVTRLNYADGSPYPGAAVLGRLDDDELTQRVGRGVGSALRATSCTLDFAPDVDVNSNPDNPVIGVRSFGSDAALVARHGAAFVDGLQSTGVAACAKHFPGHGDTAMDSHLSLPVIDRSLEELRERELVPFRAAIQAGVRTIMTSHIMLPQVDAERPATFSPRILQGLLREELGFDGVIVTDALDMKGASGETGIPEAAVRALAAGCDLLCIGTETADELIGDIVSAVEEAIAAGRLSADRVAEAAGRVRELARDLALSSEEPVEAAPQAGPVPTSSTGEATSGETHLVGIERAQQAFDVRESALSALRATEKEGPFAVVRLETEANIAVGVAPWGPFAQVGAAPEATDSRAWAEHAEFVVGETDAARGVLDARIGDILGAVPENRGVVVIGKAVHRYDFARTAVDALRAKRTTLVVDMGWPADDRAYADVATFGGSRLMGRALMAFLDGTDRAAQGSVSDADPQGERR